MTFLTVNSNIVGRSWSFVVHAWTVDSDDFVDHLGHLIIRVVGHWCNLVLRNILSHLFYNNFSNNKMHLGEICGGRWT